MIFSSRKDLCRVSGVGKEALGARVACACDVMDTTPA